MHMGASCEISTDLLYPWPADRYKSTLVLEKANIVRWNIFAGAVVCYHLRGFQHSSQIFDTQSRSGREHLKRGVNVEDSVSGVEIDGNC